MIEGLRARNEWKFFGALPRADRTLAVAWWVVLVLRGILPALFAVAIGTLVGAVQRGEDLVGPLAFVGAVFVLLQVLPPIHQAVGANPRQPDSPPGSTTGSPSPACGPPGMGHLEDPKLTSDLTMARDFDLGITGPPLFISMDFIASGLVEMIAGLASAVVLAGYRVVGAARCSPAPGWPRTGCCARAACGSDRNTEEVREAQRHADYAYRLAVEPPAAKELRLFGLASWVVDRFRARRQRLFELQWQATRLRERPVVWSLLLVVAANVVVFWSLADAAADGTLPLDRVVTFATAAIEHQHDRLRRAVVGARRRRRARRGGAAPRGGDGPRRRAGPRHRPAAGMPAREIRFRNVTFAYPAAGGPVLEGFDLTIPAGSSLAIVGQNGAGKTTLAKLLCRLYDPQAGAIEVDGVDLRELDLDAWRSRLAAVFQDFIRFELPLRDNVAPAGAPDDVIRAALAEAGAAGLADLDTDPGARLRGRHRPLRRAVAAGGAGPRPVRRAARRGRGAARRAHGAARRARRGRDLRPHPRRHAARHHDPDLAPVLDRAARRPDLRARGRPGGRAGHARRADGGRRALPDDVRPAGVAVRRRRRRGGRGGLRCPRLTTCRPRCPSMWRALKRGYEAEPRLLVVAFGLSLLAALPDALLALWLKLLADGVLAHDRGLVMVAAVGLGVSAAATWFLRVISDRVQRGFRDRLTIALESHVARLQASVATIEHHERPEYLDRLAMLRDQVFVLDHIYMSLFSTCGWILRLGVTVALLVSIHPALALLAVFALPTVLTAAWRPGVERAAEERAAPANRLARHLFVTATTAPPGKEVRVTGIGDRLAATRRAAWERWYGPVAAARWESAAVAHAGLGGLRRRVRRGGGVRRVGGPRDAGRRAAGAGGRLAAVGVHRRHGGRDRLPARDLARRLAAAGLARGLRGRAGRALPTRRCPSGSPTASASSTSPSPIPAPSACVLEDVSLDLRAGHGGGRSWARTAPARRRW